MAAMKGGSFLAHQRSVQNGGGIAFFVADIADGKASQSASPAWPSLRLDLLHHIWF